MSKPHPATTETSVMTSLAELTRIEGGRQHAEEQRRMREREQRRAAERAAQAEREEKERAEEAAQRQADAARTLEERAAAAREAGRAQAAVEVARIQAEAQARLEQDNAVRAHQLGELRIRLATGRRRREYFLGAALGLTLCISGAATFFARESSVANQRAAEELQGRNAALLAEREDAKRVQLRALDQRHAALVARHAGKDLEAARATAQAARDGANESAPTHTQLHTFAAALDALASRGEAQATLRGLDARYADLLTWANAVRRARAAESATAAAKRAHAPAATDADRESYARSLDTLREQLSATRRAGAATTTTAGETGTVTGRCQVGDPGCGIDGTPLF